MSLVCIVKLSSICKGRRKRLNEEKILLIFFPKFSFFEGIVGVTSKSIIFFVFNTKKFYIMSTSRKCDFSNFKRLFKLYNVFYFQTSMTTCHNLHNFIKINKLYFDFPSPLTIIWYPIKFSKRMIKDFCKNKKVI